MAAAVHGNSCLDINDRAVNVCKANNNDIHYGTKHKVTNISVPMPVPKKIGRGVKRPYGTSPDGCESFACALPFSLTLLEIRDLRPWVRCAKGKKSSTSAHSLYSLKRMRYKRSYHPYALGRESSNGGTPCRSPRLDTGQELQLNKLLTFLGTLGNGGRPYLVPDLLRRHNHDSVVMAHHRHLHNILKEKKTHY